MPDTEVVTSIPDPPRLTAKVSRGWKQLPRKLHIAVAAAVLIIIGAVVYMLAFSSSAALNLVVRHSFRNAELSVYIDGKLARSERIAASTKKRFGLLDARAEGSISRSLKVSEGRHVVQVRIRSGEGFEQVKSIGVNVVEGQDATVTVSAQRGAMYLAYQGPPIGPSGEMISGYFSSLRNLLVTMAGSAASAAIAFIVQEALKSRKNPPAAA